MRFAYAAALAVSLAGMVVLDRRARLLLFDRPARGAAVLAAGVAFFLAWDVVGIGLGVFFRGQTPYLSGLLVAPELPVEEVGFLTLLCYLTLNLYVGAGRAFAARQDAAPAPSLAGLPATAPRRRGAHVR